MRRLVLFATMLSLLLGVQAQHSCGKNCPNKGNGQCCNQAKTETSETLSVEDFANRMMSKSVVLVDVRTPKEFAEGHLKGATNVAWGNDFESLWKAAGIKQRYTVAVYCRSGRRSKAAAAALVKLGYKVIELEGGIMAWQKAGKPVEK